MDIRKLLVIHSLLSLRLFGMCNASGYQIYQVTFSYNNLLDRCVFLNNVFITFMILRKTVFARLIIIICHKRSLLVTIPRENTNVSKI